MRFIEITFFDIVKMQPFQSATAVYSSIINTSDSHKDSSANLLRIFIKAIKHFAVFLYKLDEFL